MCEAFSTRLPASLLLLAAVLVSSPASPQDADPVAAGRAVYDRCIGCHSPERNRTGPLHCGILGRVAGSVDGFNYSPAMRNAGITWTAEALDRFLESPLEAVPGTTMGFAGLSDDTARMRLIAWLATLTTTSPACAGITRQPGATEDTK